MDQQQYINAMNFPWTDRKGDFSWLKASALMLALTPGLIIGYWYASGQLGALPTKTAMKLLGLWSIRFLIVSLALTPLQRALNWPRLALVRRMAGVTAASYAAIHFTLFVPYSGFDPSKIVSEIVLRPYLSIGFIALAGLLALAATSTDAMLARLGAAWKKLHQWVYLIVPLGLLHYAMQEKLDVTMPFQLLGIYLLLMSARVLLWRKLPFTPLSLAAIAIATALLMAGIEAAWYALSSGIDPMRLLAANLSLDNGLRPAVATLLAGLGLAAGLQLRRPKRRPQSAGILA